jgi:hypothetical protein
MDQQHADGRQLSAWNDDNIDPLWFSDFLAADPVQDLATNAPIHAPNDPGLENMNFDATFQDFTFDDGSPGLMSSVQSPVYTLEASPRPPMECFERPLEQRQHTLPRRRSKYLLRRSTGKSSQIVIPSGSPRHEQDQSLAMQRWRNSPPEDEAASLSAIYMALDDRPIGSSPRTSRPSSRDAFRKYRGPSSSTSIDSAVSESSLRSGNSSHSAASQTKRRNQVSKTGAKGKGKNKNTDDPDRIFKCTFCCDTFKHKYDWKRHEKSLHLNIEEWMCIPHGSSVVLPLTGRVHCAYCSALDPTPEHLRQHNHSACSDGQATPRVFHRKDHLVQHLRLVHGLETLPLIDDWKIESIPVTSRCGFCQSMLNSWDERADHLAIHFRAGKTMSDWKGEHCFEPTVAARVTNAYPPYLLAAQSTTLVPFSATNPAALDHIHHVLSQIHLEDSIPAPVIEPVVQNNGTALPSWDPQATRTQYQIDFTAVLALHLGRFARHQMSMGVVPTDEMFQRESRRLLYHDGDDDWNQTVADDPKWMQEFRRRSGFDGGPSI